MVEQKNPGARFWRWALPVALAAILLVLGPALLNISIRSLTRMALQARRPDLAESFLSTVVHLKSNSALLYDALGHSQYLQGKNEAAADSFQRAVELDPGFAAAENNLGVALLAQDQAAQALEHLQQAARLDPGNANVYYNLANAYLSNEDRAAASQTYYLALELNPDHLEAKTHLAALSLIEGRLDLARQGWEAALQANPNQALALRGLGVIAFIQGDPAQALVRLQAAKALDPYDPIIHFYAGLALEQTNDMTAAKDELQRAAFMSADPELADLAKAHLERFP